MPELSGSDIPICSGSVYTDCQFILWNDYLLYENSINTVELNPLFLNLGLAVHAENAQQSYIPQHFWGAGVGKILPVQGTARGCCEKLCLVPNSM